MENNRQTKETNSTSHSQAWALGNHWRQLRRWRWPRVTVAVIAAATAATIATNLNGMLTASGVPWWNVVAVALGSLLAGLVIGSYIGAPIGAEATVCDTRWPVLGLAGLVLATPSGQANLSTHVLTGAAPAVLAGVIQAVIALLSLTLLAWAVGERFELERKVASRSTSMGTGATCTSCRPLFPTKPGTSSGPSR